MAEVGFEGDLADFFEHLEEEDGFYYTDKEELLQGYRDLRDKVNAALPALFDVVPQGRLRGQGGARVHGAVVGRRLLPAGHARRQPSWSLLRQHLQPAGAAQVRYDARCRSTRRRPATTSRSRSRQEIEGLPRFRRFGGQTAFFEGWALYAESLGKELGLLDDPYDYYGRLSDELLRAMRLVVDTGLHAKGWSRERAIEYMSGQLVDGRERRRRRGRALHRRSPARRWPTRSASASSPICAAEAESALGDRFDIRAFHRAVLVDGALPMQVLETKIREWIAERRSPAAA